MSTHIRPSIYCSGGKGAWATDGCSLNAYKDGIAVCLCDHLTNFAILMSPVDSSEIVSDCFSFIYHQLVTILLLNLDLNLSIQVTTSTTSNEMIFLDGDKLPLSSRICMMY